MLNNKELISNINNRGDFNLILQEFINHYNNKRPHSSIDFNSPMEYYKKEKEVFVSNWVNLYILKNIIDFLQKLV